MNRLFTIALLFSLGILAASCNSHPAVESAAMEIYNRYATHSDQLTVAYVGDYKAGGQVYNGVLLQAQTDEMWQWILSEFGIIDNTDEVMAAVGQMVPQMPPAGKMRTASLVLGPQMTMGMDSAQIQQLAIDVARSVAEQMTSVSLDSSDTHVLVLDPSLFSQDSASVMQMGDAQQRIMSLSQQHADEGYVMTADSDERTVWLFFYSSPMEREQLTRMLALPANMGLVP